MSVRWLQQMLPTDIAIDLGTSNTRVFVKSRGIVVNEPSVIAVQRAYSKEIKTIAIGNAAKRMLGKAPESVDVRKPINSGVITDFSTAETMLGHFIKATQKRFTLRKPRVVIAVPFGVTEVEKRAFRDSSYSAGAREVYLIEEPMAAAIGAELPVAEAMGSMIVDVGGGTTEIAVVSLSGIVHCESLRGGGDKMDQAIVSYIKKRYNILIGEQIAEALKITVSNLKEYQEGDPLTVKGLDLACGLPRTISVKPTEIAEALIEEQTAIVNAIKIALEKTPPELASDISEKGIVLSGGGALVKGLSRYIEEETLVSVRTAPEPLFSVVLGGGKTLESIKMLRQISV